ncbi:hypothetical protein L914_02293 [Phytophthora nicotianae]|uniref:Uncharacterized protein n=1 Tax=Phytophthora nicotianae TaxID=4792 RepID=W2P054_PHYNI|nr:hypothetical protein L914_02293 [Phytophthora nicotianae]
MEGTWCSGSSSKSSFPTNIESFSSRHQVNETSMVSIKPLERVYDGCVGSFLSEKSRIHLHIESDGALYGEVRQKQPSSRSLANGKKRKRRVVADHPDGIVIAHIVGNAQVVPPEEAVVSCSRTVSCDDTTAAEYCCAFEITKRLNHVDRHTLTCHLHVPVAPNAPAVGTWRFFGGRKLLELSSTASTSDTGSDHIKEETSDEHQVFQLQPVQWYQRQQEAEEAEKEAAMMQSRPPSLLYPLRPGKYEFKGFTTYDTPSVAAAVVPRQRNGRRGRPVMTTVKDECLVTLRLLPDGTLRGTSREVVQPQVCPLKGRWQANRVAYVLEYHVREAVGYFRYSGAVVIEDAKTNANGKRRETLSGKWHNVDEGHAEGYEGGRGEFELELVKVDFTPVSTKTEKLENSNVTVSDYSMSEPSNQNTIPEAGSNAANAIEIEDDDAIRAFTTGEYTLSGCATDAEGYEYAFDLQLQLRPGGKLLGKCKERIFHQISPVFGRWNPSCITYGQQYVVKHEVGMYTYSATMSSDGAVVRGSWANVEKEAASAPSEHGTFALILVNSTRQWSTFSHAYYPPRFRRAVMTTLMASARTHKLPVALWTHVFAFCSETWFTL